MLSLTGGMKYVYCEGNVSFHYKWDGLESYIKYVLNEDPRSGKVFIFIGKTRTTAKILHRESNGLTLYVRKLSEGRFQIPQLNEDKRTCNLDYKNFVCLILGEKCVGE